MQRSRVQLPSAPLILFISPMITAPAATIFGPQLYAARAAYIHVPFCRHRCGYCNFTLVTGRDDLIGEYLRAIAFELASNQRLSPKTEHEVDTLYFGGGTPTYLSPLQLRQLVNTVLEHHPIAPGGEFTVEANPADINQSMVDTLSSLRVTRLSLGAQSFRAEKLKLLERDHQAGDIDDAVARIRQYKMRVALDLI